MNKAIKDLINEAVIKIIKNSGDDRKLKALIEKHDKKLHFIPKRYRIFGGILQSMNIQFGNFIEVLMSLLIENDGRYAVIDDYSGNKNNLFELSANNDAMIDKYITDCQTGAVNIGIEFNRLLKNIVDDKDTNLNSFKHDIDLLFKNRATRKIYFLECKYNDDHDTGKFVDINRKFIKTYAYLTRQLKIKDSGNLIPILFFFNNKTMKSNIYIPETTNIRRGKQFFDEFLNLKYEEVDNYLSELSENEETLKSFAKLFDKVMNI
jgi:hypothetical protein